MIIYADPRHVEAERELAAIGLPVKVRYVGARKVWEATIEWATTISRRAASTASLQSA